jgi:hypothetical protein
MVSLVINHLVSLVINHLVSLVINHLVSIVINHLVSLVIHLLVSIAINHLVSSVLYINNHLYFSIHKPSCYCTRVNKLVFPDQHHLSSLTLIKMALLTPRCRMA